MQALVSVGPVGSRWLQLGRGERHTSSHSAHHATECDPFDMKEEKNGVEPFFFKACYLIVMIMSRTLESEEDRSFIQLFILFILQSDISIIHPYPGSWHIRNAIHRSPTLRPMNGRSFAGPGALSAPELAETRSSHLRHVACVCNLHATQWWRAQQMGTFSAGSARSAISLHNGRKSSG